MIRKKTNIITLLICASALPSIIILGRYIFNYAPKVSYNLTYLLIAAVILLFLNINIALVSLIYIRIARYDNIFRESILKIPWRWLIWSDLEDYYLKEARQKSNCGRR